MQQSKFRLILLLVPLALFLFTSKNSLALSSNSYSTVDSPDAIAVRIVPNPNHYNISRWYASRGFQGSPQTLMVDGYEAIRDGRTVYVNATNVDASNNIYTNIYLISYNQNPAPNTVDILGQIISHWKFNDNLVDTPISSAHVLPPNCSISTLSCASDNDCSIEQKCETSGSASSTCLFKTPKSCVSDADCPTSFFCDSIKAQITRDVKRAGQLQELRSALTNFKEANNSYPLLSAGTYLSNNSVSLWPSWSQILLSDLAVSPSLIDPINRLGACPGYDPNTCWNQDTKKFVSISSVSTALTLPSGSYAFAYQVNSNGSAYNLCATMESPALGYQFSPNNLASSSCTTAIGTGGQTTTTPPQLIDVMLTGEAHQPFNGFIKVASSRPLTWLLTPTGDSIWSGWHYGPSPVLQSTSNPNQKKVYAPFAGINGEYPLILTVTDDRGKSLNTTTTIAIFSSPINITAENGEYIIGSTNTFDYSFTFSGKGFTAAPHYGTSGNNTYLITGPTGLLPITSGPVPVALGGNEYRVTYSNITPPAVAVSTTYGYQIKVIDSNGAAATKDFSIKIDKCNLPISLNFSCNPVVRLKQSYSCLLGSTANSYTVSDQPNGLIINGSNLAGTPTAAGTFPVKINATNTCGNQAEQSFSLQVNTYCGDGLKQTPNDERTGGPDNNGQEKCDGSAGVTANVASSSINLQYGCTTGVGDITPYPITTNDKCSYKPPTINDGGGFCGDGLCQVWIGENSGNCPGTVAVPECVNSCVPKTCAGLGYKCGTPNDTCGQTLHCGSCSSGESCGVTGQCHKIQSGCTNNSDCNKGDPRLYCNAGVCETCDTFPSIHCGGGM